MSGDQIVRIDMPRTSNVILPYEPGYTGHWEAEKRRKETPYGFAKAELNGSGNASDK